MEVRGQDEGNRLYASDFVYPGPLPSRPRGRGRNSGPSACPSPPLATVRRCRYRKVVESLCKNRLGVVKATASIEEIEEKIGAGQVEQLIQQVPALLGLASFERVIGGVASA